MKSRIIVLVVGVAMLLSMVLVGCAFVGGAEDIDVKVVVYNPTATPVYREIPDFADGEGIANAILWYGYDSPELTETTILESVWNATGEVMTHVVRDINTQRLLYRESPDFADGYGIDNYMAISGVSDNSTLEEVWVPLSAWDSELEMRTGENLPHSQHIGKLIAVDVGLAKPLTVRRWYLGNTYDEQCFASQSVVDMWIADTLNLNDWVIISYIDEIPDTQEINVCIVVDKVYKSW